MEKQNTVKGFLEATFKDGINGRRILLNFIKGEHCLSRENFEEYELEKETRNALGRYTLGEAAIFIHDATEINTEDIQKKLMHAACNDKLQVCEPGTDAPYFYGENFATTVRNYYEEAYWDKLNSWLKENASSLDCTFQKPGTKAKAPPVTSQSSDDWKTKARAITDRLALEKYKRGEREITARNTCDAVATELAKDTTTHGIRSERSAGGIRNGALRGWKFIPPTGTSGTKK